MHSIFLLKAGNDYEPLFQLINSYISKGFTVIFGIKSEESGFKSDRNFILMKMKQSRLLKDVDQHVPRNALRIVDVQEIYAPNKRIDVNSIIRRWISIVRESKRSRNFKGIVIISGGGRLFSDSQNQDKLLIYEHALSDVIARLGSLTVICCYLEEALDSMHYANLVSLVNAHHCIINSNDIRTESRQLHASVVLEALVTGTEDVLGKGSWNLISRTMKLIYGIDENMFISNPKVFEEKLQKVLGASSEIVLGSIIKKVKSLLV